MSINLHLGDCLEAMLAMPDNSYELAIVDPPYGLKIAKAKPKKINNYKGKTLQGGKVNVIRSNYTPKDWDNNAPYELYFSELQRISKNQIIWGGNYFNLPPTKGIIVWNKFNQLPTYADGEMAWTSFDKPLKILHYLWDGFKQGQNIGLNPKPHGNHELKEKRIHPTQKPVKLYEWLLDNYAKEGDSILDTHLGSGSIALACHNRGYSLDAYEIDEEYYNAATERLRIHQSQLTIF